MKYLSTKDLAAWFREDPARWTVLSAGVQKILAKHSPFYVPPESKPKLPRGGNNFKDGVHPQKGKPHDKNVTRNKKVIAALLKDPSLANRMRLAKRFKISLITIYSIGIHYGEGQVRFSKYGPKGKPSRNKKRGPKA